jgi:hypothetical protein
MRKAGMQEGRGESAEWPYFDCWATKGGGSENWEGCGDRSG